jgi:phage terminase large subunit GpA-like protein
VVQGHNKVTADGRLEHPEVHTDYRSIRLPAILAHPAITTVGDLAADWADAERDWKRGVLETKQHFYNSQLAMSWIRKEKEPEVETLRSHVGGYLMGVAPVGVQVVTHFVDVQKDHVWFMAVGWGHQFEGWVIDARRIETGDTEKAENWHLVRSFAAKRWPLAEADGWYLPATVSGVDMRYHGETVRQVCLDWAEMECYPCMGYDQTSPYIASRRYKRVKINEFETRYDLNSDMFKDSIHHQLYVSDVPGPGYLHLPSDMVGEHLKQLIAEHQVRKRAGKSRREVLTWQLIREGADNHLWDCLAGNRFLAELKGVAALGPWAPLAPRAVAVDAGHAKAIRTKY